MDPSKSPRPDRGASPSSADAKLPIQAGKADVPSFGCIVYLRNEDGVCRGRVANLAGIEGTASDQRALLGQIVARFKSVVGEAIAAGDEPPWIDPPEPKRDGESKVFLPVHL